MATSVAVLGLSAPGAFKEAARIVVRAINKGEYAVSPIRGEIPDNCLMLESPKLECEDGQRVVSVKQVTSWLWDQRHQRALRRQTCFLWGGRDPTTGRLTLGVGVALHGEKLTVRARRMYGERAVLL